MADMAFVPLERADEVLMPPQDHSTCPPLIRGEPGQQTFLSRENRRVAIVAPSSAVASDRGLGAV